MRCRFADRIEPHKDRIPEEARRVIEEEMAKLSGLESASSEFNVTRNYLDWLTAIPWGHYTQERLDIQHAQKVMTYDRVSAALHHTTSIAHNRVSAASQHTGSVTLCVCTDVSWGSIVWCVLLIFLPAIKEKKKEKFMLFSDHNGSLLRRQPGAMTIGHSHKGKEKSQTSLQSTAFDGSGPDAV